MCHAVHAQRVQLTRDHFRSEVQLRVDLRANRIEMSQFFRARLVRIRAEHIISAHLLHPCNAQLEPVRHCYRAKTLPQRHIGRGGQFAARRVQRGI